VPADLLHRTNNVLLRAEVTIQLVGLQRHKPAVGEIRFVIAGRVSIAADKQNVLRRPSKSAAPGACGRPRQRRRC
jgi:hypothetical protein